MSKIMGMMAKNIKLLLRSRSSALIIILGPLLIILLVGVAFNTTGQGSINVGVYSDRYSGVSNSFVDALKDQKFNIVKYNSKNLCVEAIKQGTMHACVIFPADLEIRNDRQSEIELQIDYTKVNLAYAIQDAISSKVEVKSTQISKDLTQVIINKLQETQNEMTASTPFMVSLSTDNSAVNESSGKIETTLKNLNLDFNVPDYGSGDLDSAVGDIGNVISGLQNSSQASIKATITSIDQVKSSLSGLKSGNISSDKKQAIDGIIASLGTLQATLSSTSSLMSSNFSSAQQSASGLQQKINGLVGSVNANLADVRAKFDNAKKANVDVGSQISLLQKTLSENAATISKIQSSRQKIVGNIQSTEVTNVNTIVNPIKITRSNVVSEKTNLNLLLPSLIIMVIMFISILISSTIIVTEKTSQAHFRNFMSPTSDIMFMIGNFISSFFILILQSIIIIAISSIFFGVSIASSFFGIFFITLLAIFLFIIVGMLIGFIFNSEETATLAAISISSIMLFLSGVFIPLESMPPTVQSLVSFNPFVIFGDMLRKTMIFNTGLLESLSGIWTIIAMAVILMFANYFVQKFMHRHFLHRYSMHFFKKK
jgi:ABC-2 type transport system permease protein